MSTSRQTTFLIVPRVISPGITPTFLEAAITGHGVGYPE